MPSKRACLGGGRFGWQGAGGGAARHLRLWVGCVFVRPWNGCGCKQCKRVKASLPFAATAHNLLVGADGALLAAGRPAELNGALLGRRRNPQS